MSDDSNISQSFVNGLKWLVNTGIALLAAGGSVVAILQYFNQFKPPATPAPVFMTTRVIASTPWSGPTSNQTDIPPTITDTPIRVVSGPVDLVYF